MNVYDDSLSKHNIDITKFTVGSHGNMHALIK